MKFVRAVWKLLVGIKDALVLIFMLLFFAGLYGVLSARPPPVGEGVLDLNLNGDVVEQPARAQWSEVANGGAKPAISPARPRRSAGTGKGRRPGQGCGAGPRRLTGGGQRRWAISPTRFAECAAPGKPVVAYARRLHQRHVSARFGGVRNLAEPLGAVAIAGPAAPTSISRASSTSSEYGQRL